MELQRYEMGDYCSGYVPNDDGEVCMSYDVRWLEESHQRLLDALKEIIEQTDGRNNSVMGQDRAYSIARAAVAKSEGKK